MEIQDYRLDFNETMTLEHGMEPPKSVNLDIVVSNHYEYVPGITELHHFQNGKIAYNPQQHELVVGKKGFTFAVLPINTTCLYVNQNRHSTVFIVFFSIFTGISGVVFIAFLAYCLIKHF